ncbi:hypothetical protein DRJ48_00680 [Candidatus Woesearchaeota archaeon]|nr:type II secretion system F family protein [Candidatus Woesearchaeota archaeon]RLE43520.1 MAG: hypothetical protein DRJ48_00680 [Candidatus Woesearchaeota archaeon]
MPAKKKTKRVFVPPPPPKLSKGGFKRSRVKLEEVLLKSGFMISPDKLRLIMLRVSVTLVAIGSILLLYLFLFRWDFLLSYMFIVLALVWLLGLPLTLLIIWVMIYLMLDIRAYARARKIETVLADFFQLASANIRAGMSVEKAMWYAVRPRFGVLAKEMERVAKDTMSGKPLEFALEDFAKRYDSKLLKRSISLLIEGIRSGGEIGDLLYKISLNISESEILKRDMAANVSTYSIFIIFGSCGAAPVLFALSGQLLRVITGIFSNISFPREVTSTFPLSFSGVGLSIADYNLFAIVMLTITSFFSAIIVATVRKGNAKSGVKLVPLFIGISLTLYFIVSSFMGNVFGKLF